MKYTVEFILFGKRFSIKKVKGDNHYDAQRAVIAAIEKNIVFDKVLEEKPTKHDDNMFGGFSSIKDVFAGAGIKF